MPRIATNEQRTPRVRRGVRHVTSPLPCQPAAAAAAAAEAVGHTDTNNNH